MNLTDKLRQFMPEKTQNTTPAPKVKLKPHLNGQEKTTPWGNCYVVEKHFPLEGKHGNWPLSKTREILPAALKKLGQPLQRLVAPEDLLFIDTETTGLSGGTGTYAFLVGLGRFTEHGFVVTQFLMRDFHEELALLYLIDQRLQRAETIVSFNGKIFDLPLLQTRFTISRTGLTGLQNLEHLDLLPMARRLWRRKLASCSLNSLEENILGVSRVNDIPGFAIPSRYFQFLQRGDGSLLKNIVKHNQIDILSMAVLLQQIQLTASLQPEKCSCPWEAEALAALAETQKEALLYLNVARKLTRDVEHTVRLLHQTALIYKRQKDYATAASLWQEILKLKETDLVACEELAKYYEHKLKDLQAADQITRRALAIAWQARSPKIPGLERRLSRIGQKLSSRNKLQKDPFPFLPTTQEN